MTIQAIEHFLNTKKGKVNSIYLNNNKVILLDYPGTSSVKSDDISIVTIAGEKLIAVKEKDLRNPTRPINFTRYIVPEFVEAIDILDDDSEKERIDPYIIK